MEVHDPVEAVEEQRRGRQGVRDAAAGSGPVELPEPGAGDGPQAMQREKRELEANGLRHGGQEQVFVIQPAEAENARKIAATTFLESV